MKSVFLLPFVGCLILYRNPIAVQDVSEVQSDQSVNLLFVNDLHLDPVYKTDLKPADEKKLSKFNTSVSVEDFFKLGMSVLNQIANDPELDFTKFDPTIDKILAMLSNNTDIQAFVKIFVTENPIVWIAEVCRMQQSLMPNLGLCHLDLGEYGKDSPAALIEHVFSHIKEKNDLSKYDAILLNGDFVKHGINTDPSAPILT